MAWRSHGKSHAELIENLRANKQIKTQRVFDAMLAVDRGFFTVEGVDDPTNSYMDKPKPIGFGATISAPHMHAQMCELLAARHPAAAPDSTTTGSAALRVLDVGSGSGYLTAVLAELFGPGARVVGVDHIPELVERSRTAVRACRPGLLDSGRVRLELTDGREGYPAAAPFDIIHVGAAAPEMPPALCEQLAPGGRMVVPVGAKGSMQRLVQVDKDAGGVLTESQISSVIFVPLTDSTSQLDKSKNSTKVSMLKLFLQHLASEQEKGSKGGGAAGGGGGGGK